MFKESIFEGACANSTGEVLLMLLGSILLGVLLGYLIWGWYKKKYKELEEKIILLNQRLRQKEVEVEELTEINETLQSNASRIKSEFNLQSSQFASATTRIKSLEESLENKKSSLAAKEALLDKKMSEIEKKGAATKIKKSSSIAEPIVAAGLVAGAAISSVSPKKGRGRPKKSASEEAAKPKRRGRPPKAKTTDSASISKEAPKKRGRPPKEKADAIVAAPKRRGRPPKVKVEGETKPKRRGRPRKVKSDAVATTPKRRGRPAKIKSESEVVVTPKRRGRPPKAKSNKPASAPKRRGRPAKIKSESEVVVTPKRRGRPPKAKSDTLAPAPKRRGRPKTTSVAATPKTRAKRGRPRKTASLVSSASLTAAQGVFGRKVKGDDLTLIEGIGPKISKTFQKDGLKSWSDISKSSEKRLRSALEKMGPRHKIHDPTTWARQAEMAVKGEWKKLKVYQDSLKGGRK